MNERKKSKRGDNADDSEWEDVDEHEREVFATTGYFDVPDCEAHISAADQKMLEQMEKKTTTMNTGGAKKSK